MNEYRTLVAHAMRSFGLGLTAVAVLVATASPQSNAGAALGNGIGGGVFDVTAGVLLKTMKAPGATIEMGPRKLEFGRVSVNQSALNILEITNGTNEKIEIKSMSLPASGFRLAAPMSLPFTIPPQTQALVKVEFTPARIGDYGGQIRVLYLTTDGQNPHKMEITLKGKGIL